MEQSSASMVESYFNLSRGKPREQRLAIKEVKNSAIHPTVFIHGNLASGRWWLPVVNLAPAAGIIAIHSSYLVDLLGHGDSSDPLSPEEMNLNNLAQQVNEFVLTLSSSLGQKLNLVGHSAGGLVSALAVSINPDLYKSSLLISPVGPFGLKFGIGVIESFKRAQTDPQWLYQVMSAAVHPDWPNRDALISEMSQNFLRSAKGPGFWLIEQSSKQNFNDRLINTRLFNTRPRGRVLSGVHDLIVPPEDSRKLAEVVGFEFEKLGGLAHCPNTEDPKRFRKLMDAYFLLQDVFAQP